MSNRWYPLYQRGNPQLRIFLPNLWMKLVNPARTQQKSLPNVVHFECSMEMTKYDIRQYLKKIYNVEAVHVRTRIAMGTFRREPQKGYVMQDEDKKIAYVTLPQGENFVFPSLCPEKTKKEAAKEQKNVDQMKNTFKNYLDKNSKRPGLPSWFSL